MQVGFGHCQSPTRVSPIAAVSVALRQRETELQLEPRRLRKRWTKIGGGAGGRGECSHEPSRAAGRELALWASIPSSWRKWPTSAATMDHPMVLPGDTAKPCTRQNSPMPTSKHDRMCCAPGERTRASTYCFATLPNRTYARPFWGSLSTFLAPKTHRRVGRSGRGSFRRPVPSLILVIRVTSNHTLPETISPLGGVGIRSSCGWRKLLAIRKMHDVAATGAMMAQGRWRASQQPSDEGARAVEASRAGELSTNGWLKTSPSHGDAANTRRPHSAQARGHQSPRRTLL